jgi:membrane protein DedA with SNARE-associated domain
MTDWIINLINHFGYLGIGFLMFLETVFPPIPSEVIMPIAGLQAARGTMTVEGVVIAGTMGAMLGNFVWYLVARSFGLNRMKPLIDRFGRFLTMDWAEVERTKSWFERYGAAFVFFARMLPTVRSVASIPAGLVAMPIWKFLLWSTIGTAIWTAGLAIAGYLLGNATDAVDKFIGPLSTGVIAVVILAYLWRVIRWKPSGQGK